MRIFLQYFQLTVAALMVLTILMQPKNVGFSSSSLNTSPIQTKKRGAERVVYLASIVFAVLFVLSSVAFLFVK